MSVPDDTRRGHRDTLKGVPNPSERTPIDAPNGSEAGAESSERGRASWPEIEHVYVNASDRQSRAEQGPSEHVLLWTEHHVYVLDSALVCTKVLDRRSNATLADHRLLGARLLGGQGRRRDGAVRVFSHPFPGYGQSAVFGHGGGRRPRMTETSPVERLVLRQRTITVDGDAPDWERITGKLEIP